MTLYSIINKIPGCDTITIAHYLTGEILVDCEAVNNIIDSNRFYKELKHLRVYKLEVGKEYGDLIIHVCEEE